MTTPDPAAVLLLTQTILNATNAVEQNDWAKAEKFCYSAARQSRMLLLAERAEEKERKYHEGD